MFRKKKMLPPPVGIFQTREELLKHVREFALTRGYMLSIKDSSKERYVTLACNRGGVYRKRLQTGENMRQRKTASRLTNCPFEVVGKKDDDLCTLAVKNSEHNHEPSKDVNEHPSCRRFTEEEVIAIRDMTAAGKRPRQILKALRQNNPNLVSDSRNVYNVKAKLRRQSLSGVNKMEPSFSSSGPMNGSAGTGISASQQFTLQNDMATTGVSQSQACLESKAVMEAKSSVAELCRHFYTLGWVSGTGGSVTLKVHVDSIPRTHQLIVMSPSGVQKERMVPEDIYVLSSDGFVISKPTSKPYPHKPPKWTDCAPLFMKVYEMCSAGAVIHSHGMESCLITMINPSLKEFRITHLEMIKGIQGHHYSDELVVPIIENTDHEVELIEPLTDAIKAYPKTTAVLVRNHGVYIWGDSWISAKTQAECYHYLFDAALKLHQLGLDWSTPSHGPIHNFSGAGDPICNFSGAWLSGSDFSRSSRVGASGVNYMTEPSQHCILLDVEGTTTPMSFITNVLFPYALENVGKHLAASYDIEETQEDIHLLRSLIQDEVDEGVLGAVPIPPGYVGKELVIASLVAMVEAMIRSDRKVIALEQLLGHIWRTGFQRNDLVGVLFDDVPEALERWRVSGIKVYVYSTCSREVQQLLFAKSNYGKLRKYFSGYFDTTLGNKKETRSFSEIAQTVGVDKPSDILFVTGAFREAVAASAAGLEVIIAVRRGNRPLPENHGFRTVGSLLEI